MTIYGRTIAAQLRGTVEIAAAEVGKFLVISHDAGAFCISAERLAVETPHRVKAFTDQSGRVVTIQRTA